MYYEVEPFGEWRADVRTAQLAAILANTNRDPKKRASPYEIKDFMLFEKLAKPKKAKTEDAVIQPETIAWLFAMGRKNAK